MKIAEKDITIVKKSYFVEEFQLINDAGIPIPLTNTRLRFVLKESLEAEDDVLNLVMPIISNELSMFKIELSNLQTDIDFDYGVWWIYRDDLSTAITKTFPLVTGQVHLPLGAN